MQWNRLWMGIVLLVVACGQGSTDDGSKVVRHIVVTEAQLKSFVSLLPEFYQLPMTKDSPTDGSLDSMIEFVLMRIHENPSFEQKLRDNGFTHAEEFVSVYISLISAFQMVHIANEKQISVPAQMSNIQQVAGEMKDEYTRLSYLGSPTPEEKERMEDLSGKREVLMALYSNTQLLFDNEEMVGKALLGTLAPTSKVQKQPVP